MNRISFRRILWGVFNIFAGILSTFGALGFLALVRGFSTSGNSGPSPFEPFGEHLKYVLPLVPALLWFLAGIFLVMPDHRTKPAAVFLLVTAVGLWIWVICVLWPWDQLSYPQKIVGLLQFPPLWAVLLLVMEIIFLFRDRDRQQEVDPVSNDTTPTADL